jgi:hypothetical protein
MENLISRRAVACLFGTSYQTITKWEKSGRLPVKSIRIGKVAYYPIIEIERFKEAGLSVLKSPGRKNGHKLQPLDDPKNNDIYFIRKEKPVFEYPELLINFYQPARINRLVTVGQLLEEL